MSSDEWTPLTDENVEREQYEPWRIVCPNCEEPMLSPYDNQGPKLSCGTCGQVVELAMRTVDSEY